MTGLCGIVPVRGLEGAKTRLRGAVPDRAGLVRRLLDRVLGALAASGVLETTLVVSPDPAVEPVTAAHPGARFLRQRSRGLNPACEEARCEILRREGRGLLVALADLPCLQPDEVRELVELGRPAPCLVLAPDREEGGTNLLLAEPPELVDFCFGTGSFQRYLRQARERGLRPRIYRSPGTAQDLDTPAHLEALG